MTVAELLGRISSHELAEWMAYYELEPFGPERMDLGFGVVASTIANVHRGKKSRAFKPDDFMPIFQREKRRDSVALSKQLRAALSRKAK